MSEYVELKNVITAFEDADTDVMADYDPDYGSEWGFSHDRVNEILQTIPCADVEPVRYGQWYWADDGYCRCSECKQKTASYEHNASLESRMTPYCPICGARMEGTEDIR